MAEEVSAQRADAQDGARRVGAKGKINRGRKELSRYEQRLRNAKNDGKLVRFALATDTYFTNEDCTVKAYVVEVDKDEVLIETKDISVVSDQTMQVSLNRALIVATVVLP